MFWIDETLLLFLPLEANLLERRNIFDLHNAVGRCRKRKRKRKKQVARLWTHLSFVLFPFNFNCWVGAPPVWCLLFHFGAASDGFFILASSPPLFFLSWAINRCLMKKKLVRPSFLFCFFKTKRGAANPPPFHPLGCVSSTILIFLLFPCDFQWRSNQKQNRNFEISLRKAKGQIGPHELGRSWRKREENGHDGRVWPKKANNIRWRRKIRERDLSPPPPPTMIKRGVGWTQ